ncbi:two-partner secretion domain-containing protein [Gloeomargarita lithophora]
MALPQGGVVTQGQAVIQQESATKLNINQSTDRAVINWNGFSIGAPEWVNFQQPSSTSATLNRVTGNTPSSIAGKLTANGQIFLINPNGIMFLPTARVDVAGLVASTLNIQDSDFMRGILRFEQMPGKAPTSVVNQGLITVKEAGFAALVAPAVQNSGVISARLGKVVLASGTTVSLDFYGDGLLSVTVDPNLAGQITDIYGNKLNSLIDNQGNITAPGGIVTLTAQAAGQIVDSVINTSGMIEAKYAENRNGVIVLSGGSQGIVAVNGELNVSGERGGKVEITGEKIALNGNALVDASGNKGGGIVNIGGNYQGKGILPNALETTVSSRAQIKADALTSGNGGEVIVWADGTTKFAGFISAKGGIISGDGGFAEVSGKDHLLMAGFADLSATNGKFGTLLLDPGSITIQDGGNTLPPGSLDVFNDAFIAAQLGSANLTISTSGSTNGGAETITIIGNANINWSAATTLTLNAGRNIFMNPGAVIQNTSSTTGFNAIVFNANQGPTATSGTFYGIETQGSLQTSGGNIILNGRGGNSGDENFGILVTQSNSRIQSQAGSIQLTGTSGATSGSLNRGIGQQNGAQVTSTTGSITYNATGPEIGLFISETNTLISSTSGPISLTGTGSSGIYQQNGAIVTTAGGDIEYTGTGTGTGSNTGILISDTNTKVAVTAGNGSISLIGTGNRGIGQQNGAIVTTAGGDIKYTGTGNGSDTGIYISDTNTKIAVTTGNGSISLTGTGGFGIYQQNSASVTTVSGDISYQATGITSPGIILTGTTTPITSTTGNITLTADTMQLNDGTIQSSGKLLIQPLTPTTTIGLNSGSGTLNLDITELNNIQDGFSSITIGRTDSSGAISVGGYTFTDNLILQNPNGGGISINGALSVGIANNLTLKSGGIVTQTQAITANGLELLGDGSFTLTNANNDISVLAGNTTSNIIYLDKNSLSVTDVNSTVGLKTSGNITVESGDTLTIEAGTAGVASTGGTTTLKATNDIILGTASNFGDTRGKTLVLNAGRDIIIDNQTSVQADGSGGIDLSAGRNFAILSAITAGSRLNSNSAGAPINIKVGGTFTLNNGSIAEGVGANGGNITITADQMELTSGIIGSTGQLLIQPLNTATTIGIGTGATGTLNLDTTEIGRLANGFSLITIGSATGTGNIDIRTAQFKDNVIIRTPLGAGNINLNGALSTGSGTETGTITLQAGNNIIGNTGSSITTQGKDITLNSDRDSTNGGAIELTGTTITSNNGNITLGGGIDPLNNPAIGTSTLTRGIELNGATLTAGAGNITLTGKGFNSGANNYGIYQFNSSQVSTTTGNITYTGTGGNGTDSNYGVFLKNANTTITSNTGALKITGTGNGTGSFNYGIIQALGAQVSTTTGDITYTGTGGNGISFNYGVFLQSTGTKISSDSGAIKVTGTGQGTGVTNIGIFQFNKAQVSTTSGDITYIGTGGNGTNENYGVLLTNPNVIISSDSGAINITGIGQGTGAANYGIFQQDEAKVTTTSGDITYTGTGGNGTDNNYGVFLKNANTTITSNTGALKITGTGNGTGNKNYGIYQIGGAQVATTAANITYTGTGSNVADAIRIETGDNIIGNNTSGTILLKSTNNAITLNDATVKTTEDIIINSPGSVTQNTNGGLFADGLELLGAGAYTLNNPNNDITTLAADTTNKISYTDTNSFTVGTVNATNGITSNGATTLTALNNGTITIAILIGFRIAVAGAPPPPLVLWNFCS